MVMTMEGETECFSKVVYNSGTLYLSIDWKICEFLGIGQGDIVRFVIKEIKKKEVEDEKAQNEK